MPRIRTIKPDAFRSETLSEVSLAAERTFLGLLTEVDDQGRIKERPAVLNGALWALRPEHTVREMERDLEDLHAVGLVCRYQIGTVRYLHVPTFAQHQRVNRPTASQLPGCPVCPVDRGGVAPEDTEATLFDAAEEESHQATVTPLPVAERRG